MEDLLDCEKCYDLESLSKCIYSVITNKTHCNDSVNRDLVDPEFLEEVRSMVSRGVPIYFGKTLRDLKCVIVDERMREHSVFLQYKGPKNLAVVLLQLPHSPFLEQEYNYLEDIINKVTVHVNSLAGYFHNLEQIDRFCTVMEPVNPTFKEDYRRIMLDDRIWLHVEVTPEGLASNVHLVGHSEQWQDKLETGLLSWDHDEDIVENISRIFDLLEFPVPTSKPTVACPASEAASVVTRMCTICLCPELPGLGVPQSLCQNPLCGVYYHRNCLFQWLVACSGGRTPAFCVATGSCPTCFQPIACSERDN